MVGKLFSTNRLFVKSQREDSGPHRAIEYHHALLHDVFQFVCSVSGHDGVSLVDVDVPDFDDCLIARLLD